jgi:hypothetical protein|tara:strand:- start:2202 stop:2807 length:606 start_codon:yes stop_codon:yes gene_type:complete
MTLRLNGSSSGFTEIDAPAAAGSNTLTLPTGNGSAGQVLSTNGSGVLSFVNAITEVDLWYLTADKTSDGDLTSVSRNDHEGNTQIGTGMSVSSGVFTFPNTGKWLIICKGHFVANNSDSCTISVNVTLNNSSFNKVVDVTDGNNGTGARTGADAGFYFLDVTDTSQVKVKFTAGSLSSGSQVNGNTSFIETHFMFIRLGDT